MLPDESVSCIVLIILLWPTQPWNPLVLELLEDNQQQDLVSISLGQEFIMQQCVPQLIGCLSQLTTSTSFGSHACLMERQNEFKTKDHFLNWLGGVSNWMKFSWPVEDEANFPADLYAEGYQYQSLNAFCLAISSTHEMVDGISIGSHPTITRILKGMFNSRPRY